MSGLNWSLLNQLVAVPTTLLVGIVLARILGPSQFGLVAMVTVITQFGVVFADLGLGSAIVQKQELSRRESSTVFWVNCLMGLAMACLLALAAPLIAAFYGQPILTGITRIVAVSFVINSLGTVQRSLLQKNLDFRKLFFINTWATVLSGLAGIVMAFAGWGVWSLVAKLLVESGIRSLSLWLVSSWRPLTVVDFNALRYVLGFGLPLTGTQSINYWARNIDNLAIGRVWGDAALGNYNRAYSLMLLPLGQITSVVGRVIFPSLASIHQDKERVKRIFLKTVASVALLGFPVSIGIFVLAEPLILTLYGPKWEGSIELLRILSLLGINQSVGSLNGLVYQSQNATMLQFKWGLVIHTLCVLSIVAGLPFGARGVAIAYTATSIAITIPNWMVLGRVIPMKTSEILRVCAAPFFASIAMGVVVAAIDYFVLAGNSESVRLSLGALAGLIVFFGLISAARPPCWEEAKQLVMDRIRKANPADPT